MEKNEEECDLFEAGRLAREITHTIVMADGKPGDGVRRVAALAMVLGAQISDCPLELRHKALEAAIKIIEETISLSVEAGTAGRGTIVN